MTRARSQRGSAPLESIFSIVLVLFLVLGLVQVAFALYGRNVVAASAHEGARAAVELGRTPDDASAVATETVREASGGLVDELHVAVSVEDIASRSVVRVEVSGVIRSFGPIPMPVPVSASSTSTREVRVP